MKPLLRMVNGAPELRLTGYVVQNEDKEIYDWYGYDAVCPLDVVDALGSLGGKTLTVKIDGYGGSIWAGSTIYTELMNYPGTVNIVITGLAASAMSTIAMASAKEGNTCYMSPMAMMMIHNVQGGRQGDYRDMEHESGILRNANETAVNAYRLKSGLPEDKIREMMDAETFLDAKAALELGLIDGILFTEDFPEDTQVPEAVRGAMQNRMKVLCNSFCPPNKQMIDAARQAIPIKNEEDAINDEIINQALAALNLEKQRFGGYVNA